MVRSSVRRERRCVQARRTSRPRRFFSKAPSGSGLSSGFQTTELEWQPARDDERSALPPPDRWQSRRRPWPGSASSRYLNGERRLPANVPRATINGDLLREAPQGSMWAAPRPGRCLDRLGGAGSAIPGFASGGTRVLFRFGSDSASRLAVTEAAIDAMSLAAIVARYISARAADGRRRRRQRCGSWGRNVASRWQRRRTPIRRARCLPNGCGRLPTMQAATGFDFGRPRRIGTKPEDQGKGKEGKD
ncbi:hypothetical protein AMC82_PD00259 (plasmid) [Rhizobium phaseoli]|nr:hypothetical protein AMC84_PD00259 [Rhizobium phaseoli]ANL82016.1 hypothetical protein AMC82_PD00259 [Rhizobium phaseoli]